MEVEGGDIAGVSTTGGVDVARLRVLIQSWEAVVEAQLKDAKRRLSKASKVARELRLEGYATVDVAAATEAAIATSAINCDDAVRRALVLLAMFAGSAPSALPLGGSALELGAYELWQRVLTPCDERGGHSLVVRDVRRMLPLSPATRAMLVEALQTHAEMHARLHSALKRHGQQQAATAPPATHRPSAEESRFVDGTTLDAAVEDHAATLIEGLTDAMGSARACRLVACHLRRDVGR